MNAMEGGKKSTKKRGGDKDKKGGAVELGSVLAPAVLLGLQQLVKDGAKDKRRVKRGGANEAMFRSVPAPFDVAVAPLVPARVEVAAAGKLEVPPSAEQVVVPQEAGAVPTDSGSKPMEGGAKSPCSGGKKDKKDGGKKKEEKKDGGKKDKKEEKKDGGKKKEEKKDGGKKKEDKKDGGKKKEDKKDGGKKKEDKKDGGKKKEDKKDGGKKKEDKKDGGKKDKKDEKYGGALALYAEQLENITRQLDSLMRDD